MIMFKQVRFGFWKVFWVVLALFLFLALIGLIASTLASPFLDDRLQTDFLSAQYLLTQAGHMLMTVVFFYILVNQFYKLIGQKASVVNFLPPALLGMAVFVIWYLVAFLVLKEEVDLPEGIRDNKTELLIFSLSFSFLLQTGLAFVIAYLTYLRDERKRQKDLEAQKMQLEIEKSQANLNFLKAQINPHFLHNTLNFLYAKSLPYSPELSEGILTLSEIMRYALNENTAADGMAPLKEEVEHVRNVIRINQLRFNNNLKVDFSVEGSINGKRIIPFVLITLVENAFKHGELKNEEHPIRIALKLGDHDLDFRIRNRKKAGNKELSTGIGLQNIRKRLELAYKKDFSMDVHEDLEFYETTLRIYQV